jgi:heme-degrading monooxygenase HmoA
MFIAMNRFRVIKGKEPEFERIWAQRESHLDQFPGFKEFNLLRGPEAEEYTLYASHTVWQSKQHFEDWTKSEAFRKAHGTAGGTRDIYLGPPIFEGFETVL